MSERYKYLHNETTCILYLEELWDPESAYPVACYLALLHRVICNPLRVAVKAIWVLKEAW